MQDIKFYERTAKVRVMIVIAVSSHHGVYFVIWPVMKAGSIKDCVQTVMQRFTWRVLVSALQLVEVRARGPEDKEQTSLGRG